MAMAAVAVETLLTEEAVESEGRKVGSEAWAGPGLPAREGARVMLGTGGFCDSRSDIVAATSAAVVGVAVVSSASRDSAFWSMAWACE